VPDYAGIRPKLTGPGEKAADFMIDGPAEHGLPGLVHLFGIESPGLTSSLSIAKDVTERLIRSW
jgi:L-2-hydroxyglutarate oxidase LhgO